MRYETLSVEHVRDLDLDAARHPRGMPHLSAASGLVWRGEEVIAVADDEHHIGIFDVDGQAPGRLLRVLPGDLPTPVKARKKLKPDTEALLMLPPSSTWPTGALLALGSGSRPNRQTGLLIPLDALDSKASWNERDVAPASVARIDLAPLYAPLRAHFDDLNIEGAWVGGDELLLLQRGNKGAQSANACIAFALPTLLRWLTGKGRVEAPAHTWIERHDLGHIGDVPLCFTDGAALPHGRWVFSAVAENTRDSYADGVCAGSVIGIVNADGTLHRMWSLPTALKVEGVAVGAASVGISATGGIPLLMATDADDPAQPAHLLRALLPRD